jgi:hypothetical protein
MSTAKVMSTIWPPQVSLDEGIIKLKRKTKPPRAPGSLLSTIQLTDPKDAPSVPKPSLEEYEQARKHEKLGDVRLFLDNRTTYYLIPVLYRWSPDPPSPEHLRTRWLFLSECPPGKTRDYTFRDSMPGAYYFIYGTILGRPAEYLAQGDLRGSGTAALQVRIANAADRQLKALPLDYRLNTLDVGGENP